jgi:hypothetical protein
MVEGRSKAAFKTWLADRPQAWRDAVEVVAMDGFTGFKTAAAEELPDAVAVMDPFHVVRLAGDALDRCRRRVQQDLHGHRGRRRPAVPSPPDPAHRRGPAHRPQRMRLVALFAVEDHVEVEATWGIYQRMIAAYRDPDRARGRELMHAVIDALRVGVPAALTELLTLGRTLKKRAADVLAYFDRPGTSNGPTEALTILVCPQGELLDEGQFPATTAGLARAVAFVARRTGGDVAVLWVIEGTGTYGARLARVVADAGYEVVEAPRMNARADRGIGKSDPLDARRIAAAALPLQVTALRHPRADDGVRAAVRVLLAARDHMSTERTATINALTALLRVADLGIDARRPLTGAQITTVAGWRTREEPLAVSTD